VICGQELVELTEQRKVFNELLRRVVVVPDLDAKIYVEIENCLKTPGRTVGTSPDV
jgi:hypothetical protein